MRTSQSHPLEIAEIEAGDGMGRIGITFCPGKQQMQATGSWSRDLGLDVDAIARWNAAAVVSLVEQHELDSLGVTELGEAVRDAHMAWYHLPIRDVGVPDATFEENWNSAGSELRAILSSGFNVLVHCKGGLGRAGTVAARLLVELDWEPEAAITAVRAVRPGAIETAQQQAHVMAAAPVPEQGADGSIIGLCDRALGALIGLAVGDAIGTSLEFAARDTRPRLADMTGGGPFHLAPGEWTDDTAMALALMDSLIANPMLDERDLMDRFVAWHQRGTYSCTGRCFDIGMTVRAALVRYRMRGDPVAGSDDPMSAGNGSLMRLAPVVVRHWQDRATLRNVAARQSWTTHGAPAAVDACIAMAEIMGDAIGTASRWALRPRATTYTDAIASILAGSWRRKHRDEISSTGYVAHSLEAALWCVARTGNFRDAVLLAANLGEDADTTAAITGQLAGALYGASAIPAQWRERLAWGERLTRGGLRLFAAGLNGTDEQRLTDSLEREWNNYLREHGKR